MRSITTYHTNEYVDRSAQIFRKLPGCVNSFVPSGRTCGLAPKFHMRGCESRGNDVGGTALLAACVTLSGKGRLFYDERSEQPVVTVESPYTVAEALAGLDEGRLNGVHTEEMKSSYLRCLSWTLSFVGSVTRPQR
eukprot:Protomagalhaensia_wolfi_Nauph_80__1633@NODE_2007_length_1247_cov_23_903146_g582_i1_p1_GENE_NODE_2007_length_1247_cov_23_903146_g582_i1NODE_2007_length_1247_cov_23_903146_g582_i1_p1_ORF_typecomplete_len136_score4_94_NODE_2007_length_1247_cov_23_903146_g582_i1480887